MSQGHRHEEGCCGEGSGDRIEAAVARMKEKSLRVTSPRMAMLKALAAAKHPLSAEQIHSAAGDTKLDLVTVYRSLGAMEDAGIVQRHPLERGRSLYALVSPGHHHHHVICRQCGRIERLPGCDSSRIEAAARERGFSDLTHIMEVYGVCPTCLKKSHV
ncbi:MAG: Fur family transcriptional regulator [Verrucomicrobiota bacterium]|jgi:Fe2+ or Zn2+ uptake regulation protein